MKTSPVLVNALLCLSICALITPCSVRSQVSAAKVEETVILERGAHHRVVQTPSGSTYTEIANGMHYLEDGKWVESKELIEIDKEGAVARQGPNKVTFAANINSPVAVTVTTPDGKQFKTRVMGLVYYDKLTGGNVLIAELKDSAGLLVSSNQVLYPDAFTDFEADIRYTYLKDSFEQDVILRKSPPPPEKYGLDSNSARLQLWTEFFDPPQVEKQTVTIRSDDDELLRDVMVSPDFTDDLLSFGLTHVGRGKAFSVDSEILRNLNIDAGKAVAVGKEWLPNVDGRSFLVESVEYPDAEPFLQTLPEALGANIQKKLDAQHAALRQKEGLSRAEFVRLLPKPRNPDSVPVFGPKLMMARADAPKKPGFTIDYLGVTSQSGMTFKSDTTYFVSAAVTLSGTTTLEGGTVIKFDKPGYYAQPQIIISGTGAKVVCLTSAYRPAIFTAKDDNSVGETVASGTLSGYYAICALNLNNSTLSNPVDLSHVRIAYAQNAISLYGTGNTLRHAQIVSCGTGINLAASGEAQLRNVLICSTYTVLAGFQGSLRAENVTVDGAYALNGGYYSHSVNLTLVNCLLTSVADVGTFSGTPNAVNPGVTVYQTVGAGSHYLAKEALRNSGSPTIDQTLLADLRKMTTYAPIELTSDFITPTKLSRRPIRDTDKLDLGYHYDPLDYVWTTRNLSSALTLGDGVAVGIYGSRGITLQSGAQLTSEGTPSCLNRFVRYQAVQEISTAWGTSSSTMSLINLAGTFTPSPVAAFRFTDISFLADTSSRRLILDNAGLYSMSLFSLRDCELRNAALNIQLTSDPMHAMTVALTNNLVQRPSLTLVRVSPGPLTVYLFNNTFLYGGLGLQNGYYGPVWAIRDNLFDNVGMSASSTLPNSYNGYINTYPLSGGYNNQIISTRDYQSGPLGTNYYPTTGTGLKVLINAGSQLAKYAGLYHYTTTTDQIKESDSTVDIGRHCVATYDTGQAMDSDLDHLPDYVEDTNGNGMVDSGETSSLIADSDANGVTDDLQRDTEAPSLTVSVGEFSPNSQTVIQLTGSRPVIQIKGFSSEPLINLTYDAGGISGLQALLLNKVFDPELHKFTQHYFQCPDISLSAGNNTINLNATDAAGNVKTVTINYNLDLAADHTPPAIAISWPANGSTIAGAVFSIRGTLDDPTAAISVTLPDGTILSGTVDHDGNFNIGDVPIAGAQQFQVVATDPAGNVQTIPLNVSQSTVTITMNGSENEISPDASSISLSGDLIYDPGISVSSVTANGVSGSIAFDSWSVPDVPVPDGPTMDVSVTVNTSAGSAGAQFTLAKAPSLKLANYSSSQNYDVDRIYSGTTHHRKKITHTVNWTIDNGGEEYYEEINEYSGQYTQPNTKIVKHVQWFPGLQDGPTEENRYSDGVLVFGYPVFYTTQCPHGPQDYQVRDFQRSIDVPAAGLDPRVVGYNNVTIDSGVNLYAAPKPIGQYFLVVESHADKLTFTPDDAIAELDPSVVEPMSFKDIIFNKKDINADDKQMYEIMAAVTVAGNVQPNPETLSPSSAKNRNYLPTLSQQKKVLLTYSYHPNFFNGFTGINADDVEFKFKEGSKLLADDWDTVNKGPAGKIPDTDERVLYDFANPAFDIDLYLEDDVPFYVEFKITPSVKSLLPGGNAREPFFPSNVNGHNLQEEKYFEVTELGDFQTIEQWTGPNIKLIKKWGKWAGWGELPSNPANMIFTYPPKPDTCMHEWGHNTGSYHRGDNRNPGPEDPAIMKGSGFAEGEGGESINRPERDRMNIW